jgi:hypothetical protein
MIVGRPLRLPWTKLAGGAPAYNADVKESLLFIDESRLDRDARLA